MKKDILFFVVFLFSMVVVRCQNNDLATIYPYQEMVSKAQGALNSRDYETSYKTYCLMDSVYGIAAVDYTSFMYFLNLTHWYNSGSDAEKNLLPRERTGYDTERFLHGDRGRLYGRHEKASK